MHRLSKEYMKIGQWKALSKVRPALFTQLLYALTHLCSLPLPPTWWWRRLILSGELGHGSQVIKAADVPQGGRSLL
jgi:hypothetical protein